MLFSLVNLISDPVITIPLDQYFPGSSVNDTLYWKSFQTTCVSGEIYVSGLGNPTNNSNTRIISNKLKDRE